VGDICTRDKRDKLVLFMELAVAEGKPLATVLLDALKVADEGVSTGAFLVGTSEAGGSASFQLLKEYSPVTARRLVGELLELYKAAAREVGATVTDETAGAQMFAWLRYVGQFRNNYTYLRFGGIPTT
jgi:hypothetical protein